jgi:hypothetical protein
LLRLHYCHAPKLVNWHTVLNIDFATRWTKIQMVYQVAKIGFHLPLPVLGDLIPALSQGYLWQFLPVVVL